MPQICNSIGGAGKGKEGALSGQTWTATTLAQSGAQTLVPMFGPLCKRWLSWGKWIHKTLFPVLNGLTILGNQFMCNFLNSWSDFKSDVMLVCLLQVFYLEGKSGMLSTLGSLKWHNQIKGLQKPFFYIYIFFFIWSWCRAVADLQIWLDCGKHDNRNNKQLVIGVILCSKETVLDLLWIISINVSAPCPSEDIKSSRSVLMGLPH